MTTDPPFKKMSDYILLFTPMIIGYTTSAICKIPKDAGATVKIRPPSWVFGVIWPILFTLIGISWVYAIRENKFNYVSYSVLIAMLSLWIIMYACSKDKTWGVWVLIMTLCASIVTLCMGNLTSQLFLTPLVPWLFLATLINALEVQNL